MNSFHIGIYINVERCTGGMYQASLNMADALFDIFSGEKKFSFTVFLPHSCKDLAARYNAVNWECVFLPETLITNHFEDRIKRLLGFSKLRDLCRWLKFRIINIDLNSRPFDIQFNNYLKNFSLDLMFFPNCDLMAYQQEIPFITFLPDLQHRLQPEFKEVGDRYVWPLREKHFRNMVKYATVLITDSHIGREDVLYFYSEFGAGNKPVIVLPYTSRLIPPAQGDTSEYEEMNHKFSLPERYFFYPAQFWQHKNHERIIEAVAILKARFGLHIPVVFCGAKTGKYRHAHYQYLLRLIKDNNLENLFIFLDYVSDDQLTLLYRHAVGLVMPTFFGPANIPIIEAWAMECPVIYSNIRGLREQAGDAAWLVDPHSSPDISDAMKGLWESPALREQYIEAGKMRLKNHSYEYFKEQLLMIVLTATEKIKK